jgi:hypothetical protein
LKSDVYLIVEDNLSLLLQLRMLTGHALQANFTGLSNDLPILDTQIGGLESQHPMAAALCLQHQHEGGIRFDVQALDRVHDKSEG